MGVETLRKTRKIGGYKNDKAKWTSTLKTQWKGNLNHKFVIPTQVRAVSRKLVTKS